MMHGHEKSRSAVVAVKPTNKAERSAAEPVERRAETEGKAGQQSTHRAQYRVRVAQALACIRRVVAVDTRGGNRMRESCTYGSVRGAPSNGRPYRDRRKFITLLGGAAAWPLVAHAQQGERMRRIGVLHVLIHAGFSSTGPFRGFAARFAAIGLDRWSQSANSLPLGGRRRDNLHRYAGELVKLEPDVIVANGSAAVALLLQVTRAVPIVFTDVPDPIGAGFVDGMAKPGRNVTVS